MNGTPTAPELLEAARNGDNRACEQVLEENKAQRHIRGGMATRRKYKGV